MPPRGVRPFAAHSQNLRKISQQLFTSGSTVVRSLLHGVYNPTRTARAGPREVRRLSTLKDKVNEFAEIAKTLPENLQAVCFDLLLRNHLEGVGSHAGAKEDKAASTASPKDLAEKVIVPAADASKQEDFKLSDLHVKAKKFLGKAGLSIDHINNLFFREAKDVKPLYDDLKTTKTSESQIRVVLLLALRNAMTTGEFEADTAAVRDECVERKCFDVKNFGNNFNNRSSLFDFEKFTKETVSVRLAEAGKGALAEVIKELQ
jgi:hypothetical protein